MLSSRRSHPEVGNSSVVGYFFSTLKRTGTLAPQKRKTKPNQNQQHSPPWVSPTSDEQAQARVIFVRLCDMNFMCYVRFSSLTNSRGKKKLKGGKTYSDSHFQNLFEGHARSVTRHPWPLKGRCSSYNVKGASSLPKVSIVPTLFKV